MMDTFKLDINNVKKFLNDDSIKNEIIKANEKLTILDNKTGLGNEWLGWLDTGKIYKSDDLKKIVEISSKIRKKSDILVVIGIGGSYLGAKACIDFLNPYYNQEGTEVLFLGHHLSPSYLVELITYLKDKEVFVNVISKSGTTTEPALAFRVMKELMENKYGEKYNERIIATTDGKKGALLDLAKSEGYETLVVPDDIGGRYSVFTPVGLLPIATAGYDIKSLLEGTIKASEDLTIKDNPAVIYAAIRSALYKTGYKIEILVNYEQKLNSISEWWKQLFAESEGKQGKGLFVSSASFSTDLHSIGQYIQDGPRHLFETVIEIINENNDLTIKEDSKNLDGLNYLSNKTFDYVNKTARKATTIAHVDGGVPNVLIQLKENNEFNLAYLLHFFMKSCAISGYMLDVNPFDQPGVEDYKTSMFKLLGKPGY